MDLELLHYVRPVGLYGLDAYRKLLRYGAVAEAARDEAEYLLLLPAERFDPVELDPAFSQYRVGLWFRRMVLERFVNEQILIYRSKENGGQGLALPVFTRRELEIIQMAGSGIKNREIGRNLFISEKTVKHHLSKIFKKLQIRKRTDLRLYI